MFNNGSSLLICAGSFVVLIASIGLFLRYLPQIIAGCITLPVLAFTGGISFLIFALIFGEQTGLIASLGGTAFGLLIMLRFFDWYSGVRP